MEDHSVATKRTTRREESLPARGARPRRIVHMSSVHRCFDNRILYKHCLSLVSCGHEAHLVVPHDHDQMFQGVHIHAVPKPRGRLERIVRTARLVYTRARALEGDAYIFHDPELMPFAWLLARRGKLVIYDVHEDYRKQILQKRWIPLGLNRVASRLYGLAERLFLRRCHAVLAASDRIADQYRGKALPTVVVENFPRLSEAEVNTASANDEPSNIIVDFGGISERTAIREVVDALGRVEGSDCRLILGGGIGNQAMWRELQAMPGWRRVQYVGLVSREEMFRHLRRASLGLVLFNDLPNNREIRSNRLYEAMSVGLPVMVSEIPAWRAFIDEHGVGWAVRPNAAELARRIDMALADPAELARLGRQARQTVLDRFSWEAQFARVRSLLENTDSLACDVR